MTPRTTMNQALKLIKSELAARLEARLASLTSRPLPLLDPDPADA